VTGGIGPTADVGLSYEALRTLAARLVDDNLADSVVATGSTEAAGVDTLVMDTGCAAGAVKGVLARSF
jgi:hypothetical protein